MVPIAETLEVKSSGGFGPALTKLLRSELGARPGRVQHVLAISAYAVLAVILSETFQIPEPALSVYYVFLITKEETASTFLSGSLAVLGVSAAVLSALAIYMVSIGEPGLRMPLMAVVIFTIMFISRASRLGAASTMIGLLAIQSLTLLDVIPLSDPLPAAELLTQRLLWLWVVILMPVGLVIVGNIVAGRDPIDLFTHYLVEELELAARVLVSHRRPADRERLVAYVQADTGRLLKYLKMSGTFKKRTLQEQAVNQALVAHMGRLTVLLSLWTELDVSESRLVEVAAGCGAKLLSQARFIREKTAVSIRASTKPESPSLHAFSEGSESDSATECKAFYLLRKIIELIETLPQALVSRASSDSVELQSRETEIPNRRFLRPDAFRNRVYVHFALKCTLSVFTAYITYNLLDWRGIQTCMITTMVVTLGSFGETAHKMVLRIIGALIGGALGFLAVLFVIPYMTTISELSLMVAVVAFFSAWVITSSELLSYAGLQIALAFFLSTLVGYEPTVNLAIGRDRIMGVLFGNLIVSIVFSTIWPESAVAQSKVSLAQALRKLAEFFAPESEHLSEVQADSLLFELGAAIGSARRLAVLDAFEPKHIKQGAIRMADPREVIDAVRDLCSTAMVLRDPLFRHPELPLLTKTYDQALSFWLALFAREVEAGIDAGAPPDATPLVQILRSAALWSTEKVELLALAEWYRALDDQVHGLERLTKQKGATK
ncbi:MAG: FUSC family protein [Oligoflexia bacterium]|nr:FUSC family protein [Oligoflexia bacterium]